MGNACTQCNALGSIGEACCKPQLHCSQTAAKLTSSKERTGEVNEPVDELVNEPVNKISKRS